MNVGLPGTGLGGLFYLLTALAMPLVEFIHALHGRSTRARRHLAIRQFWLALLILLVFTAEFWLLAHIFSAAQGIAPDLLVQSEQIWGKGTISPLMMTVIPFATLAILLGTVELFALLQRWRQKR